MKKLFIGSLTLLSLTVAAQESTLRTFQVVNKTYPEEKIVFNCANEECSAINITGIEKGVYLDHIDLAKLKTESNKAVGKLKLDCSKSGMPGAPCFTGTKIMLDGAKKSFKEGRVLNGILNILGTPLGLALDSATTALIFMPIASTSEALSETEAEITREERRIARKKLKKFNYIERKLEGSNKEGVLKVNDRVFDKIVRKLHWIDDPYYNAF